VHFAVFLVALHGGALLMGVLLLTKRHNNWEIRLPKRLKLPPPGDAR
jgi:hypothetical protein